ncbi:MAG: MT-A70 family methyltransferase [Propionibacteriaceae bacterium]|nr:MT-A70 family methyltransferase [Propionibacteriaceae bacterium]
MIANLVVVTQLTGTTDDGVEGSIALRHSEQGVATLSVTGDGMADSPHIDFGPTALPHAELGFGTVLADPPWRFQNRTGKVAPEHRRLDRYRTLSFAEICAIDVASVAADNAHLYLWVPNALLVEGLAVMRAWGFRYVSNIVWAKRRKDGGPDGRGVGFYFRNVTELILFGVRGSLRTLAPGRSQVNMIETRKREHSRKPDEQYALIEACSPGPYLELFARHPRPGWTSWGDEAPAEIEPRGRQHRGYTGGAIDKVPGLKPIF